MRLLVISFRKLFAFAIVILFASAHAEQNIERTIEYGGKQCIELKDDEGWSVGVFNPGNYCVGQDLYQSWPLFRLPHQPVPRDPLISVGSGNVSIDLMTRRLSARTTSGMGVRVYDSGFRTYRDGNQPFRAIKIGNGSIRTAQQVTVFMVHDWNSKNKRFAHVELDENTFSAAGTVADSQGDLGQYRPTEYVLENLTLQSDNFTVIMQGKKNVIRHCKIIGGNGTVNLYGPNMTFEDNEIILNAHDPRKEGDEGPVALYLEDAADSVVRNNRIVVKGHATKPVAIVLKNSVNVLLEGNSISGTGEIYKLLDENSTVKALGNTVR